jgi:hypothetical protein
MNKIEIIKDTNIVEENTADSLAVIITTDTPCETYTTVDGKIITGTNITVTDTKRTTQKELRDRLEHIDSEIASLQSERDSLSSLLDDVTVKVATAIDEIRQGNTKVVQDITP